MHMAQGTEFQACSVIRLSSIFDDFMFISTTSSSNLCGLKDGRNDQLFEPRGSAISRHSSVCYTLHGLTDLRY